MDAEAMWKKFTLASDLCYQDNQGIYGSFCGGYTGAGPKFDEGMKVVCEEFEVVYR